MISPILLVGTRLKVRFKVSSDEQMNVDIVRAVTVKATLKQLVFEVRASLNTYCLYVRLLTGCGKLGFT